MFHSTCDILNLHVLLFIRVVSTGGIKIITHKHVEVNVGHVTPYVDIFHSYVKKAKYL